MALSYEELTKSYSKYGKKFERAWHLATTKSVKHHLFHPSGREIWTAVGREGDQLLEPSQPFCSCSHFHFKVLSAKDETCYHLIALELSKKLGSFDTIEFHDLEYYPFLKGLVDDITREIKAGSTPRKPFRTTQLP